MVRGFGRLLLGAGFVLAISAGSTSAQFQVLYRFKGASDGGSASALIMDDVGNFYGTTPTGGSANKGTVFKLAPDGTKTMLYDFSDADSGAAPLASLLRDKHGNLYGTTQFTNAAGDGGGTVFKLSADGHETVLYQFSPDDPAGNTPRAELIADKTGNLYSTTTDGNGICDCGAVFKLAPNRTMTVLHAFTGGGDGYQPYAGLVADKSGNVYGTTSNGGVPGAGTVFKIAADGTKSTLHNFDPNFDGGAPVSSLIFGNDGNLYGTTVWGGQIGMNRGTVYKITPDGTETVLHSFGADGDGQLPAGALVTDAKGNLYGTTPRSDRARGTVFKVTPDGREKIIHRFFRRRGGGWPAVGLVRDADGNLYGTTSVGGAYKKCDCGTIFAIER